MPSTDGLNYFINGPSETFGRYCQLQGIDEVSDLQPGMDFRRPEYRREVFLRFYEMHLAYKSHPGAIYYMFPWLGNTHKLNMEQRLWLAFLNGNSQHIITSWMIFERFPDLKTLDFAKLSSWFNENYKIIGWDTDRRYHRKEFLKSVECYKNLTGGDQIGFWQDTIESGRIGGLSDFRAVWDVVSKKFWSFGRLSTFSYLEYLRIVGLEIECDHLFLEDMSGSKSHRNGLAKVLGRDDLDWHKSTGFEGKYADGQVDWLAKEAALLLEEAQVRMAAKGYDNKVMRDVNYFTMESTFCTYKGWHRPNRRYPNVYNDMFHDRIKNMEKTWPGEDFSQFWTARQEKLPIQLRQEDNPRDPGLVKVKQNHYRETGEPIMMSWMWPEFKNSFEDSILG